VINGYDIRARRGGCERTLYAYMRWRVLPMEDIAAIGRDAEGGGICPSLRNPLTNAFPAVCIPRLYAFLAQTYLPPIRASKPIAGCEASLLSGCRYRCFSTRACVEYAGSGEGRITFNSDI
jgi:hypothetical protein